MTTMTHDTGQRSALGPGLVLGLVSAASFGTSGTLARGLLDAGWSPGAAVTIRAWVAALVLLVPALRALRGRWHLVGRNAGLVVGYGAMAVAGAQLFYFNAVARLEVATALMIEYAAPLAVLGWLWARYGHRPRGLTLVGAAVCFAGLMLVLDVVAGFALDPIGIAWGLGAMVGLACYFVFSAREAHGLPPLVLAAGGLLVGAVLLTLLGLVGVLEMTATTSPATYAGHEVAWWLPILALGIIAGALPYTTGIAATRALGARLASFVALSEVVSAVCWAWLLLGELPSTAQLLGGVLILAGVVLVKLAEPSAGSPAADPRSDQASDHASSLNPVMRSRSDSS